MEDTSPGAKLMWFGMYSRPPLGRLRFDQVPYDYRLWMVYSDRTRTAPFLDEITNMHRACNLEDMRTLPVQQRNPGNECPRWLKGRDFRYLYYRVKYMRWCYKRFYDRWLWELKDLTQRYADWLANHRRPYRPRRTTEHIPDIGDVCGPWGDLLDPVLPGDSYDTDDDFIDDREQDDFRDDDDEYLSDSLPELMDEYDQEEHDEENMDEYEKDFVDDSGVDPTQGADDDDYVPSGSASDAASTDESDENDDNEAGDGEEDGDEDGDEQVALAEPAGAMIEDDVDTNSPIPTQSTGVRRRSGRLARMRASQAVSQTSTDDGPDDASDTAFDEASSESEFEPPTPSSPSPRRAPLTRARAATKSSGKRPQSRSPTPSSDNDAPAPRKRRKSFNPRVDSDDEGYFSEGDGKEKLSKPKLGRGLKRRVVASDDEDEQDTSDADGVQEASSKLAGASAGDDPATSAGNDEDPDDDVPIAVLRKKFRSSNNANASGSGPSNTQNWGTRLRTRKASQVTTSV